MENAKRESRSLGRLQAELTELGGLISDLWRHVRAAHHIVGIPMPGDLKAEPKSVEGPVAPMVGLFDDVRDFKGWLRKLDGDLASPLMELVPEFYERMEDELRPKPQSSR